MIVAGGHYWTAINIHNPDKCKDAHFRWKVAVALPGEQGTVSAFQQARVLYPDAAIEIDCSQVMNVFLPAKPAFVKGYVVIESDIELDVIAVYTGAQGANTFITSFHTERVQPRCVPVCEDLVLALHTGIAAWQTVLPTSGQLGPAMSVSPSWSGWAPPPVGSQWISQFATDGANVTSTTPRYYELCFDLCSGFVAPAQFPIQVIVDDSATVFLNNQPPGGLGPVPLNTLTPLMVHQISPRWEKSFPRRGTKLKTTGDGIRPRGHPSCGKRKMPVHNHANPRDYACHRAVTPAVLV
jgi:hypothetical protein